MRLSASGAISVWIPLADDRLDRVVLPAGIGQDDAWLRADARRSELRAGRVDHRLEVGGVKRLGRDLGGDHDLLRRHGGLRVVALHPAARRLQVARVRVGDVDPAHRLLGQRVWLDVRPGAGHPPRAVTGDPRACQAACSATTRCSSRQSCSSRSLHSERRSARSRGTFAAAALCLERLLCLAQPLAPIACRAQPLGQLVAASLAVELVLGGVDASPPR